MNQRMREAVPCAGAVMERPVSGMMSRCLSEW